ncbi:DUF3850 domain-containing protein [Breznakia pachnodae]|nr:DUF3850 domain-containing protein [Breznakia pachnodae]
MNEVKEHNLKIAPYFFEQQLSGRKSWELRYNDRDYNIGDILYLHEWDKKKGYSKRILKVQVVDMLKDYYLLKDDVVLLTTKILDRTQALFTDW